MIYRMNQPDDEWLLDGVRSRRVFAWMVDILLILLLLAALWLALLIFGVVTLGLGMPLLGALPFVPFGYHFLFVCGPSSATPGQQAFDLIVRRDSDLGPADAVSGTDLCGAVLPDAGDQRPSVAGRAVHRPQAHTA